MSRHLFATAPYSFWRLGPWLLGLFLSPLLFGSVNAEGQAVVGLLFSASLLLLARCSPEPRLAFLRGWPLILAAAVLLLTLLPLPLSLLGVFQPARAQWALAFPLEMGSLPGFAPLTLSPAGTVQRIWELSLLLSAFALARATAQHPAGPRALALTIGAGVLALAASDAWYRWNGQRLMLNLWAASWGTGAGTFANRNHFANWIYVGSLFAFGWVLRGLSPMRSARPDAFAPVSTPGLDVLFLLGAAGAGISFAVMSGSRGGVAVFGAGMMVWMFCVGSKSRSHFRRVAVGAGIACIFIAILAFGLHLVERIEQLRTQLGEYGKLEIWKESVPLFRSFPLFGTGLGSFVHAFSHAKTGFSGNTVWHTENDYLQWAVETGAAGLLMAGVFVWWLLGWVVRPAWEEKHLEPELAFGALAALSAFAAHAALEFVFQIPATAILAAAILGFLPGLREAGMKEPPSPPRGVRSGFRLALAAALAGAALLNGAAFLHWWKRSASQNAEIRLKEAQASLRFWPFATQRRGGEARSHVEYLKTQPVSRQAEGVAQARRNLNRGLRLNPFDWELRLERAWLDLAFSTNHPLALEEAMEVIRLNPRQAQLPLRFARALQDRDPEAAQKFLALTPPEPALLPEIFQVGWAATRDTAYLWSLTPNNAAGLSALGEFSLRQGFAPMSAQAFLRLTNWMPNARVAERLLSIPRPDLALQILPDPPDTDEEKRLVVEAYRRAGDYSALFERAERIWRESAHRERIFSPAEDESPDLPPGKRAAAAAEKLFQNPPPQRDWQKIQALAGQFPNEPRLQWIRYRTERDMNALAWAAETAASLANLALRP